MCVEIGQPFRDLWGRADPAAIFFDEGQHSLVFWDGLLEERGNKFTGKFRSLHKWISSSSFTGCAAYYTLAHKQKTNGAGSG